MPHPRYASAEIVQRGQRWYEQQIRGQVESQHAGEFLVVDVETWDYEIDPEDVRALRRAKAKHPDGAFGTSSAAHRASGTLCQPIL